MRESYTFKIAPEYTIATYSVNYSSTVMEEWRGKSLADFAAGMTGRGFRYRVNEYELSGGRKFAEHIWER